MTATGWQRAEGALIGVAGLALAGAMSPGWPWWVWPLALLAPDLAMAGYLAGPRVGAAVYNAAHLYAGGLVLALLGLLAGAPAIVAAGAVWIAHVGVDRALGYGLKLPTGFRDTHLGRIGAGDRSARQKCGETDSVAFLALPVKGNVPTALSPFRRHPRGDKICVIPIIKKAVRRRATRDHIGHSDQTCAGVGHLDRPGHEVQDYGRIPTRYAAIIKGFARSGALDPDMQT